MPYLAGLADWIMDAWASVARLWPAWPAVVALMGLGLGYSLTGLFVRH